jgi:membrane dipeptidase
LIVDAHNDLLLELAWREDEGETNPFAQHWLPKLEAGGVRLQVCPIFVELQHLPEGALRVALKQAASFHRLLRANAGSVRQVAMRDDLRGDGIGLMLSLEGVEPLGSDPALLDVFWQLGVRMVGLTWNRRNAFADGAGETGGLSSLGRQLVGRFAELGIVLDLAHASERTFWDALEHAPDAAVVISHACCRAVCDTPRNPSDDQLSALAERGGVLGLMALPSVVDPKRPTIERLIDHVDHAVEVMGIDHVGLGGDFIRQLFASGATRISARETTFAPPGTDLGRGLDELPGPEHYPRLVEALERRGYEGDRLAAILGGNFLRLFESALPAP